MKNPINVFLISVATLALQACSNTQQLVQRQTDVAEAVVAYENQLVKSPQPYAIISAQPRPVDLVLVRSPYVIQSLDGTKLATADYSFVKARPLPRDLAFSLLKVPVGYHDLVIYGGYSRSKRTTFRNVLFEAKKKYVIVEKKTQDETVMVSLAEYEEDRRFLRNEAEFYLIEKAITPWVELGSQVIAEAGKK